MERSSCSFINIHTVDNANDGGIDRCSFTANRLRRGTALDDQQHVFVHAGAHGINRQQHRTARLTLECHRLHEQQLGTFELGVLLRGHDRSDDTRERHDGVSQ